jgi:hypothetical protein
MKHPLDLDRMLEEKVLLDEEKRDLKIWEVALVEAQECDLHPRRTGTC